MKPEITFEEAKKLAEDNLVKMVLGHRPAPTIPLLREFHLEAEYCWMFFQNRDLVCPVTSIMAGSAYAISKKGAISMVGDFSDEPEKLYPYLQSLSNYFKRRGE